MASFARKFVNKAIEEYSKQVKGKVLFVGTHHVWEDVYSPLFEKFETMDINPNTEKKPDIVGDIQNCPQIPDSSYDGVIMTGVWDLLKRPASAMLEINRILKVNSLALIASPGIAFDRNKEYLGCPYVVYPMRVEKVEIIYYRSNDPFYMSIVARKT